MKVEAEAGKGCVVLRQYSKWTEQVIGSVVRLHVKDNLS